MAELTPDERDEHTFRQSPFEPVGTYRGSNLFGRYVPADGDEPAAYHVEVHRRGKVWFWAEVTAPPGAQPSEVGALEVWLQDEAVAYAKELVDRDVATRQEPYVRTAAGAQEG